MHRLPRVLAPLVLVSSLGSGCADDQELFVIRQAASLDDECVVDDTIPLAIEAIDVDVAAPFAIAFVLENLQQQNGQSNTNIADDGELKLETAEVRFTPSDGGLELSYEITLASTSLPSGSTLGISIPFPSSVTQELAALAPADGSISIVEMGVVIIADRTSQVANGKLGQVRSREFVLPVQLCDGCVPDECVLACGFANTGSCTSLESDTTDTTDTTGP